MIKNILIIYKMHVKQKWNNQLIILICNNISTRNRISKTIEKI